MGQSRHKRKGLREGGGVGQSEDERKGVGWGNLRMKGRGYLSMEVFVEISLFPLFLNVVQHFPGDTKKCTKHLTEGILYIMEDI